MISQLGLQSMLSQPYAPLFRNFMNGESDASDTEDEQNHHSDDGGETPLLHGENRNVSQKTEKRSRLIGYNSQKFSKGKGSSTVENISVALGVCFVVAVTCYAVFLGYNVNSNGLKKEDASFPSSSFKMEDVTYDESFSDDTVGSLYNEERLPSELMPLNYILYVVIDDMEKPKNTSHSYRGLVKIRMKATANSSRIVLHSTNNGQYKVHKVAVKTINVTDIEDILVTKTQYNQRTEMLDMTLNQQTVSGYHYELYIGFYGNVSTDSFTNGIYAKTKNGGVM